MELPEQTALLAMGEPLPEKNRDHDLPGDCLPDGGFFLLPSPGG